MADRYMEWVKSDTGESVKVRLPSTSLVSSDEGIAVVVVETGETIIVDECELYSYAEDGGI
jgi:hypothetical protein